MPLVAIPQEDQKIPGAALRASRLPSFFLSPLANGAAFPLASELKAGLPGW